jgi:hypothetical protein
MYVCIIHGRRKQRIEGCKREETKGKNYEKDEEKLQNEKVGYKKEPG